MSYEQRNNSGSLFANNRKEKDSHPSHTGICNIDGIDYYISAWVKEGNGKRFFSLSFKLKQSKPEKIEPAPKTYHIDPNLSDEIPF
jgi:hypothetical protein